MADLQVDIVTPRRSLFSGRASEVRIPGWEGEFGVRPGHDILLSLLRGGVLTVVSSDGDKKFVVGRGFVEVGPERVAVLADLAEPAESVDKAAADADVRTLSQQMTGVDTQTPEFKLLEEKLEVARARLTV